MTQRYATESDAIEAFLGGDHFAVVGASTNRAKYGNKVLRCYLQNGRTAYPINPRVDEIEGVACSLDLASLVETLGEPVHGVSIITPSAITERVMQDIVELGIKHVWMQPGAESDEAVRIGQEHGVNVIAGGPCLLVVLGYRENAI